MYSAHKQFYCKEYTHKDGLAKCMGRGKGLTHTKIPADLRKQFQDYFRRDNAMFFDQIGQDFGWNIEHTSWSLNGL